MGMKGSRMAARVWVNGEYRESPCFAVDKPIRKDSVRRPATGQLCTSASTASCVCYEESPCSKYAIAYAVTLSLWAAGREASVQCVWHGSKGVALTGRSPGDSPSRPDDPNSSSRCQPSRWHYTVTRREATEFMSAVTEASKSGFWRQTICPRLASER